MSRHSQFMTGIRSSLTGGGKFSLSSSSSSSSSSTSSSFSSTSSSSSLKIVLLHGSLDIRVNEAQNLPNMDSFHKGLGEMMTSLNAKLSSIAAGGDGNQKVTSDPYVTVSVAGAVVARTFVVANSENPVWNQRFDGVPVAHRAAELSFLVKDDDVVGSQLIGSVSVPAEELLLRRRVEGTFPVAGVPGASLSFSVEFVPIQAEERKSSSLAVEGTYFPMRSGGKVTLYQDADVAGWTGKPIIGLGPGGSARYEHRSCWRDIEEAIRGAKRLVYVAGWSVYHNVRLVRDSVGPATTLGELLKVKSQEGVRVLLLVWDDPTSTSALGYKRDGVMGTFDEETKQFFKNSSVQVLLCPRAAGKGHSWVKKREVGTIYTHHQKTVIVDAEVAGNFAGRQIMAFVGGLDLCKGRYDTPDHTLFHDLTTTFANDFHNPILTPNDGCPREPWHDLHSRIEGPAAYDVLQNFEERWRRASKKQSSLSLQKLSQIKVSFEDSLLRLDRIPEIFSAAKVPCLTHKNPESWNVQIFRSIDSGSVKGFPKDPREATRMNLACGKNIVIDMSIHTAYVKAIRSANHFIYIENQYFIGSSFNWDSNRGLGANNLIPMEIALKIASKIRSGQRFAVYIVVPMWPEGDPKSIPIQTILFWQSKTMQMMYEMISDALREAGLDGVYEPQDYLNFFCLGNREESPAGSSPSYSSLPENAPQVLARKNRRFMIYVHSKGMIVDDEYVIIGSANINQRSMEGTRDTEIAMGAHQPHHTWEKRHSTPNGQVYGYRMSLWAEHMGGLEEIFKRPERVECVRRVRELSEQYWRQFMDENRATQMKGHLLKYPVYVDKAGKVKSLPGCETFPDLGGNILGTFTGIQENLTI